MGYMQENAAARDRILDTVRGLSADRLATPIEGGWTVAALLAHLAFWDRVHVGRLRRAIEAELAAPPPLPEGTADLVNDAAIPSWLALPGADAVRLFEKASAEADTYLAGMDPTIAEGVRAAGYPRLVERFRHRAEHGDAIAAALAEQG
jgi:hypothetical protein